MRRSLILSAAVSTVALPAIARATFIAGDSYLLGANFTSGQYTASTPLKSQDATQTVSGFVTGPYSMGSGTSNFAPTVNGLNNTLLGASASTSGKVTWGGLGSPDASPITRSNARGLTAVPNSSIYYESFLINAGTFSTTTLATRSVLVGFSNAAAPVVPGQSGAPTGLFVGFAQDGTTTYNNNGGDVVIRYNSTSNVETDQVVLDGSTNDGTTSVLNNTYLVVAEIDVPASGTTDTVNWWLNPTSATSDATLTSSSSASGSFNGAVLSTTSPGSSLTRLGYYSYEWLGNAYFDEPRISTDLASLIAGGVVQSASNLTWTGANDGSTWDAATPNFINASGATVAFNNVLHDNVTFNDANGGNYNVILYGSLSPGSTTVNNSNGAYTFNGNGNITGTGALNKMGTSSLTLNISNSYTGGTNVSGGTLILANPGALPSGGGLNISGGSVVASGLGSSTALKVSTLSITGTGTFDLQNTGLDVTNSSIGALTALLKNGYNNGRWNGSAGIVSSTAAANASHLTALGVIVNDNGSGTPLYGTSGTLGGTFDGITPADGDVLVKYTYYGDTNLSGKVDGTDYSRIDAAYLADLNAPGSVTGWYNGDFNYDGLVNGSDYTLIDNAFNTQSTALTDEVATSTSEIAGTTAVPEPIIAGYMLISALGLLGRRQKRA